MLSLAALRDPAVLDDPYPLYRRLREESPVHRDTLINAWLVSKAFTRRAVELMRPSDPAHRLRDMLGIGIDEQARLRSWSDDYAAFVGNIPPSPEDLTRASRAVVEMTAYLRDLVAHRRRHPEPDRIRVIQSDP